VTTPTVSVCVPTYNGSAYLAETLASISTQTFGDFEIVIIDDGSSDDTVDIAERFAATDRRARIVRNAERAGSSARNANKCLDHARGEWIKFLFQDDLMAPTCLERMLEAGRRGRLVIAWHEYGFAPDVDASVRQVYAERRTLAAQLPGDYAPPDAFCGAVLRNWLRNFVGPTSTSFIHRECFSTYGSFNPYIVLFPDLEYWMRVGSHEGVSIVPECLVTFRVHQRSISAALRTDPKYAYANELDGLQLIVNLARAPEYAAFRAHVDEIDSAFDAEARARATAFDLRWQAVDARYRRRDSGPLTQWKKFCAHQPLVVDLLRDVDAQRSLWSRTKDAVKARL
jgi:glycosyltransferase involved in cell wall biosynthesis